MYWYRTPSQGRGVAPSGVRYQLLARQIMRETRYPGVSKANVRRQHPAIAATVGNRRGE